MNGSNLKRWRIKTAVMLKGKDDVREVTHRLFDGGNLHVSPEMLPTFEKLYAADIAAGYVNYLIEKPTPVYKLLTDLDIYEIDEIPYSQVRPWIVEIQKVVKQLYPQLTTTQRSVIVCTTSASPGVNKNGNMYVKLGLGHLIWPNIRIKNTQGLTFRAAILQHLEDTFGKRHIDNQWEDVVDHRLYGANGLRMVGSAKAAICGRKCPGDFCEHCHGQKRYHVGRVYQVEEVIDGEGNTDPTFTTELKKNTLSMVKQTSIRTYDEFITPQTIPTWFDNFNFEKRQLEKVKKVKKYTNPNQQLTIEDQAGFREHNVRTQLQPDTPEYKMIKKMMNKKLPEVYHGVEIMSINICNRGENNYYLIRTNCTFCMNKADYHNGNTVYFVITEYGICQKCFCRCDTVEKRRFGLCRDFHSANIPLSAKEKTLLFPNIKTVEERTRYTPSDPRGERKLLKELLQNKLNEMRMWQDYLDGKVNFQQRFDSNGAVAKTK